jgi:hypothetical protein
VDAERLPRFTARTTREPFAFRIFIRMISDESEMVAVVDYADLLAKFEAKFPD